MVGGGRKKRKVPKQRRRTGFKAMQGDCRANRTREQIEHERRKAKEFALIVLKVAGGRGTEEEEKEEEEVEEEKEKEEVGEGKDEEGKKVEEEVEADKKKIIESKQKLLMDSLDFFFHHTSYHLSFWEN